MVKEATMVLVLAEGSVSQKQEANRLLESLPG